MSRSAWGATLLIAALATPSSAEDRLTVWDLVAGTAADEIPDRFVDYACGTRGGPPGRPLAHFRDYTLCRADARGFHEVYFRYDDEQEYVARAQEQPRAIEAFGGTEVSGIPVIVSALFDDAGKLRGLRIVTDARGAEPGERNDHWALGTMLRHRFGDEGWTCKAEPPAAGETPVTSYLVKDSCTKTTEVQELLIRREYLHRRGQLFADEFGKVQPTAFVSQAFVELWFRGDGEAAPRARDR